MFELDCFMDIPACCLFSQIFQLFQWNIIGIILVAFLVMAAMSVWLLRNHWRPLYLLGIWFLFLIIMSIGSWQVYNTEHVFRETWKNTLLNMTNSFANTTERMGYAQISPEILNANDLNDSNVPNAPDDLAYQNIRNTFSRWCTEVPFVARVYTLRLRQDKTNTVTQVISSGADLNSLKNLHQHQPYNEWLEIYRKGFDGDTVLNENITSTQYGNFITAIAPLRDPEHPEFVEAVLVVDFRVDQWNPIIRQTQWISSQFLILLAALYLAVIYLIALLYRTISRFTATNQELIHAKKTTEAAAKAKNDFLANMNHDIRTPMNVIVGFTDILMHRLLKNGFVEEWEESKGILEIIQKNSQDLLTIINDFLDFSQIEANLLQIESVPLSLKQLIEDISQIEMPFIMEKKLDFSIQYKNVPELILGDPVRLRQILFNLINNAIKFTAKGKVEIRCETPLKSPAETTSATTKIKNKRQSYPESTILKISIHDTGVGISPEQMEYLFQPFAVDHSLTHEFGGTGLGLSIAKRLAQLMDGNITVKSEPNVGSVFTLILHVYLPAKQESTITTEEK
ncbi:MAG: hypothetical protein LBP87_07495, partial [Planctomycetaceae bacterium]|nr:hypothetical protein [Planctomycetaceae bacterium]